MIHALADGHAILVPANFDLAAPAPAVKAKAKPAAKKASNVTKAAKPKRAAKKPAGDTKAAIAYRMLILVTGTTRAAIVKACDGWSIDIKQFVARKNLRLHRDAEARSTPPRGDRRQHPEAPPHGGVFRWVRQAWRGAP